MQKYAEYAKNMHKMQKICKKICSSPKQYVKSPICRICKNYTKIFKICNLCKSCHHYAKYAQGTMLISDDRGRLGRTRPGLLQLYESSAGNSVVASHGPGRRPGSAAAVGPGPESRSVGVRVRPGRPRAGTRARRGPPAAGSVVPVTEPKRPRTERHWQPEPGSGPHHRQLGP